MQKSKRTGSAPAGKKHKGGKIVLTLLVVLLLCAGALFLVAVHDWKSPVKDYEASNPYITPYGTTMVSAHRSGGGIFPENTLMAFEGFLNAEDFGTDIFEFDLHITKDGRLILLHDDTLDRTTDSRTVFGVKNARPENYTIAELKKLNFGAGFTDEDGKTPYADLTGDAVPDNLRVATLEEVLELLEQNGGYSYIIEIKNKKDLGYRAADRLYAVLQGMGLLDRAIVGTFNGEVTKYLDETYPELLRSASIKEVLGFYLDAVLQIDRPDGAYAFDALQIPANQFLIRLGTSRMTDWAHRHNVAVQYWTINDPEDMRLLKEINADCVMSDDPSLAYAVLHEDQ